MWRHILRTWPEQAAGLACSASRARAPPRGDYRGLWALAASAATAATFAKVKCESSSETDSRKSTLRLALSVAAQKAGCTLVGGHPVSEEELGYVYRCADGTPMTDAKVQVLKDALDSLVNDSQGLCNDKVTYDEAVVALAGQNHALSLLSSRVKPEVDVMKCGGQVRLSGYNARGLAPNTAHLALEGYELRLHKSGGVLLTPGGCTDVAKTDKAQTEQVILETRDWACSQGAASLGMVNAKQEVGRERKDFILAAEYRQEARLRDIVRQIQTCSPPAGSALKSNIRVICIAGPTSSGKTTFANKLCQYLSNEGMHSEVLTVDHYYLPLDRQPRYQPRKQRSDVDYDHIESMDVDLVNDHIMAVIRGEEIKKPVYNMKTGYRDPPGKPFKIPENGILVIEGIHALNPLYTEKVPRQQVFKIFLSPVTALQIDDVSVVKSTDSRLLRRMSRDYLFRGHSASRTLSMWANVRRGEGQWIFPFQGQADFVMNSAHEYELNVLKPLVEPLLRGVPPSDANFEKAQELLDLLDNVAAWYERDVPSTSLLREFLGNGAYDEH